MQDTLHRRLHLVRGSRVDRGRFLAYDESGSVVHATGPAGLLGVSLEDRADIALCATGGVALVRAAASFPRGAWLTSDSSGAAIEAKPGKGETVHVRARAEQSAAPGDLVSCALVDWAMRG